MLHAGLDLTFGGSNMKDLLTKVARRQFLPLKGATSRSGA